MGRAALTGTLLMLLLPTLPLLAGRANAGDSSAWLGTLPCPSDTSLCKNWQRSP